MCSEHSSLQPSLPKLVMLGFGLGEMIQLSEDPLVLREDSGIRALYIYMYVWRFLRSLIRYVHELSN